MSDWPGIMKRDWDARAREDHRFYIKADDREFGDWTLGEWLQSGKDDLAAFLDPYVEAMREAGIRAPAVKTDEIGVAYAIGSVMEIGCGAGRMTYWLVYMWKQVFALDISPEMLRQAQETLNLVNKRPVFIPITGRSLPVMPHLEGTVDFVISYGTFPHIPDPDIQLRYLAGIGYLLRPGGHYLIHLDGDHKKHTRLKREWKRRRESGELDGWDEKALKELDRYETWMRTPLDRKAVRNVLAEADLDSITWERGEGTGDWFVGGMKEK